MINITKCGTKATVKASSQWESDMITQFIKYHLTHYSYVKKDKAGKREVIAIYAYRHKDDIYIHTGAVEELALFLRTRGYKVDIVTEQPGKYKLKPYTFISDFTVRDYQRKAINHLKTTVPKQYTKGLGFQPGAGKTFCALRFMSEDKGTTALIMKPTYCSQWTKVIPTIIDVPKAKIAVIQGADKVDKLLQDLENNTADYDIVIFSSPTIRTWINKSPLEFNNTLIKLGVKNLIIDEVHEQLHLNYTIMSLTTVELIVGLSGTYFSKDKFIENIQDIMIPRDHIYDTLASEPYIQYLDMRYMIDRSYKPKTSHRNMSLYNHIAYEEWLCSKARVFKDYTMLLKYVINNSFIQRYEKGDRCLVFVGSVKLAKLLEDALHIAINYDEGISQTFKVVSHTGSSPYSTLLDNDIIIATPGKAGTAVDIPNLTTVVSGYITASIQRWVQMLGRLRKLEKDCIYVQLVNEGISKHVMYQQSNSRILNMRCAKYLKLYYRYDLGA